MGLGRRRWVGWFWGSLSASSGCPPHQGWELKRAGSRDTVRYCGLQLEVFLSLSLGVTLSPSPIPPLVASNMIFTRHEQSVIRAKQ